MSGFIQACKEELNDNLPYLRHPVSTVSSIAEGFQSDLNIGTDFAVIQSVKLFVGTLLFAFVVVPVGIAANLLMPLEKQR